MDPVFNDPIPAPSDTTDPGFRQNNMKVGAQGEFTLPDVVPLVNVRHASPWMLWGNERWVRYNFLFRGFAGTAVDWFVFFSEIGKAYPLPSYSLLLVCTTTLEEKYSEEPFLSNTVRYAMTSYDPKAAEMIFAPKAPAGDPIQRAAKTIVEEATKEYLQSSEYIALKAEVEQNVQMQVRRNTFFAAGMKVEAAEVDLEIIEARTRRVEARSPVETPVEAGLPVGVETPAQVEIPGPPVAEPPIPAPESTPEPVPAVPAGG